LKAENSLPDCHATAACGEEVRWLSGWSAGVLKEERRQAGITPFEFHGQISAGGWGEEGRGFEELDLRVMAGIGCRSRRRKEDNEHVRYTNALCHNVTFPFGAHQHAAIEQHTKIRRQLGQDEISWN
jgi:hypothetical protein